MFRRSIILIKSLHDMSRTLCYTIATMNKISITVQKLKKELNQITNKKISRAWKGYGTALFLEDVNNPIIIAASGGERIDGVKHGFAYWESGI